MDALNGRICGGGSYEYDFNRYLKVDDAIKIVETPVDMDTWVTYNPEQNKDFYLRRYNPISQASNPQMAQVNDDIKISAEAAIRDYYSGKMSEDAFISKFHELADKNFQANHKYVNHGLTSKEMEQGMMEVFYGEFRRTALDIAVKMNNEEGKQYVTGDADSADWKYYNSDYYYKSESAIAALTKGIKEIATEHGHESFQVPDYRGKERWLYNNFNTAFSNPMVATEQTFLDRDAVPPEGLVWFFQQGSNSSQVIAVPSEDYRAPTEFDAKNFLTATAWASFRGPDGTLQKVSSDMFYDFSDKDKHTLGKLFQFEGQSPGVKAANHFLMQLQVYRRGYFSDHYSNYRFETKA